MKSQEQEETIKGLIKYQGVIFEFELINNKLVINYSLDNISVITTAKKDFDGAIGFSGNEKIKENIINGTLNDGRKIIFKISSSFIDYFKFSIICNLYCYIIKTVDDDIASLKAGGEDVFNLFNNSYYFSKNSFDSKKKIIFKNKSKGYLGFSFRNRLEKRHLRMWCRLYFSETSNIDEVFTYYSDLVAFFRFLYNRNLISFNDIKLLNNKGKIIGNLYVSDSKFALSKEEQRRAVPFHLINNFYNKIMNDICSNKVYDSHYRDSYSEVLRLDIGKLVSLMAGIEYEFDHYNKKIKHDKKKSSQTKIVKQLYEKLLDNKKLRSDGRSIV